MTNFTWIPIIPLIGGLPLGTEMAFNRPPEFVASYSGFWGNDSHYMNYQNNTLGRNLEYRNLDEVRTHQKINFAVGTPPCAALSQLNTGTTPESKGVGCQKNEWMYRVFEDAIDLFDVDAVMIENAPALFTPKGRDVADKLFDICFNRGYSLTLYKTTTSLHGIPQNRDRTFAIGWKSENAPIMNWYKRDRKDFAEYLAEVDNDSLLQQDDVINTRLFDRDPYYRYIQNVLKVDVRQYVKESGTKTTFNAINSKGLLRDANRYFHEVNDELGIKFSDHAIKKFDMGKGIWDGSVHVFDDCMNAVIGRNMVDTIHPNYDRSMTIREALHMMGFPHDFEVIGGSKKVQHVAQNVPTCTARDMSLEVLKYLNGELEYSETNFIRQNNHNGKIEFDEKGNTSNNSVNLEEFFDLQSA